MMETFCFLWIVGMIASTVRLALWYTLGFRTQDGKPVPPWQIIGAGILLGISIGKFLQCHTK